MEKIKIFLQRLFRSDLLKRAHSIRFVHRQGKLNNQLSSRLPGQVGRAAAEVTAACWPATDWASPISTAGPCIPAEKKS